jgi:hypothetical protein
MNKNWKNVAEENIFFLSKIAIDLSLGLLKGCPSYRKSLQPSKEIIRYFKKLNLLTFPYICHFSLPSPDPIRIRIRIHSTGTNKAK